MLLGVEGGGVILEVLDEGARLGALIEDFGLAFVNATTAVHGDQPWLENVHLSLAPFADSDHPEGASDECLRIGRSDGSDPWPCDLGPPFRGQPTGLGGLAQ
jgi:hypothetical protein